MIAVRCICVVLIFHEHLLNKETRKLSKLILIKLKAGILRMR